MSGTKMDFAYLSSFFMKGDIPGALEYMSQYEELAKETEQYRDLFERANYLSYDIPEELNGILLEYQVYFRDVFFLKAEEEHARTELFKRIGSRIGMEDPTEKRLIEALPKIFERNGYHILTGVTNGHLGPYVWKTTEPVEYSVELPEGLGAYNVNILRGFVMRSWMDYLTFGTFGTGGWAGEDGIINFIETAYDFDSEDFKVRLLKHEAQHVEDMKRWKDITPAELEYRAKLVELFYCNEVDVFSKFMREADASRPDDSHALASSWIADKMSDLTGAPRSEIQARALQLFKDNTRELTERWG